MQPNAKSHPAVTAAGVVAILFGAFGVLMAIIVELSMLAVSHISSESKGVPFPEAARAMASLTWLFLLLLAVFGIFVGAGIVRRRNWARISILVWGGLMACFSAITMAATFFVMNSLPPTSPRGVDAAQFAHFIGLFKWIMVGLYAIPLGVGIWWLILFTRKPVVEEFNPLAARLHPGKTLDASGFPQEPPAPPSFFPGGPACPLPLLIIAGLYIFSSVYMLAFLIIPHSLMSSVPLFLFGHAFYGRISVLFFGFLGVVNAVCGVGIIKLKPWALDPLIWCGALFSLSGIVTLLSPQYVPVMREAMAKMMPANVQFPTSSFFFSDSYLKSLTAFGFVFGLVWVGVMVFYRKRYLEAARAKHALAG